MAFSVDAPFLKDVLDQIGKGDIQLPDFQRGWVWDDAHIGSLIASISLSYPSDAVMFLEAGVQGGPNQKRKLGQFSQSSEINTNGYSISPFHEVKSGILEDTEKRKI